jgi:ADP-ribosylglycohydrolase
MSGNARAMVLGSMAADSLALGVHWVYNANVIDRKYGRIEELIKPEMASYHKGKEKGAFTHYGDQAMLLLESVAGNGGFRLESFAASWVDFSRNYSGYVDGATTDTLANIEAGKAAGETGSQSADLSAASRIAPLVYRYPDDIDQLLSVVKAQAKMTHNHNQVLESAEFFARVTVAVLGGAKPGKAMTDVAEHHFKDSEIAEWVSDGMDSIGMETRQTIADFGQACETEMGFPSTIHLIATYADNFKEALVENIMAGGDSAARGMAVGMILGAHNGMAAIPPSWLADLRAENRISELLDQIDANKG